MSEEKQKMLINRNRFNRDMTDYKKAYLAILDTEFDNYIKKCHKNKSGTTKIIVNDKKYKLYMNANGELFYSGTLDNLKYKGRCSGLIFLDKCPEWDTRL